MEEPRRWRSHCTSGNAEGEQDVTAAECLLQFHRRWRSHCISGNAEGELDITEAED